MKKTEPVILTVILIISLLLSFCLLTRGHLWWDDFASYIMQAESLLQGTTQQFIRRNMFTIEESFYPLGPIAYPWGYPLLLAPVLAIFGLKVLALKLVSSVFYVLFLFAFHRLARLRQPAAWSLLLTAIFAFNPALLEAHDLILSDIPFLFFSTLTLFLIEKFMRADGAPFSLLAGAAIGAVGFAAFATRTNGFLFLGVVAITQLVRFKSIREFRENLPAICMPYITFGALVALGSLLLPNGQGSYFTHYSMLTPEALLSNVTYYLQLPAEMFKWLPLAGFFSVTSALLFLTGLFSNPRKNAAWLAYLLLTLGLFISWPERQGLRFIFPILPIIVLVAAEGWQFLMGKLSTEKRPIAGWAGLGVVGTLVGLSLFVSVQSAWSNLQNDRAINGPFDPVSAQMFEFVREQTPADSVVIFFKPRAMRLFTDRDSFMTDACQDFGKGDYVVFHEKQGGNGQVAYPEGCTIVIFRLFFKNLRFTVFKVNQ